MTNTMAFAISTPATPVLHSSSSSKRSSSVCTVSNSAVSTPKNAIFQHVKYVPQLGFTQWNGLKQLGIRISQYSVKNENKVKCKGKGVYASLFGVGAPEALVIGVVALLVFGPKGLAEVARNLGKTLRAFQPTIRELQEVSRDFKSTLEREIGLDDIDSPVPKPSSTTTPKPTPEDSMPAAEPNGSPTEVAETTTQDYLQVSEARLKGALAQLQKEQDEEREKEEKEREEKEKAELQPESSTPSQDATEVQDTPQETNSAVIAPNQIPESKPLQEVASVVSPASTPVPTPAATLESES